MNSQAIHLFLRIINIRWEPLIDVKSSGRGFSPEDSTIESWSFSTLMSPFQFVFRDAPWKKLSASTLIWSGSVFGITRQVDLEIILSSLETVHTFPSRV